MDIRAKVMSALAWSAAGRLGAQLISWVITILVIRILTPEDYGLIAMAAVLISFLVAINDIGLDAVLVQKKDLTRSDREHVFGIVIVINALLFVLLMLAAPWVADFYDEARLTPIIRALSCQFLVIMFDTLPVSRLERELAFKGRSFNDMISVLSGSLVTVLLALDGLGVWALVWGTLTTTVVRTIGLNLIARCLVWPRFSLSAIRGHLAFGGFVSGYRALYVVFADADKFIGGKLMGKEALGYYAVASHIASLPIQKLAGVLNAVAFPAFCHANTKTDEIRYYLLKSTRVLSIVSFPIFLGISVVALELVLLLLGEKWVIAALPLQVLAFVMPLRVLGNVITSLLFGIGRPDINAVNYLLAVIVMPLLFIIGAEWGPVGLSVAWLTGYPLLFAIFVWRACRVVSIAPAQYFVAVLRPFGISALMYAAVWSVRPYIVGSSGELVHLIQLVLVGVCVYAAGVMAFDRVAFREMIALLRRSPEKLSNA